MMMPSEPALLFTLTMAVQSIHSSKGFPASVASEWTDIEVQSFVALTIVLASEAFTALGPLAHVRSLLSV